MMTIVRQLRARPVQVLSVLLMLNGLAVGAMMMQAAETGIVVPVLGAAALLSTLAALIALGRLVRDPLGRLELAVRTLSAEVMRGGGDAVSGLGLTLASSGDLTASTRSLLRLRQVLADRHRRTDEENQRRRNVDELLAAELCRQSVEEQVRLSAVAELSDGLRRLGNGQLGLTLDLAMPAELELLRVNFNRASAMMGDNLGADGSHAALVRDTGILLASSADLAKQGADQATGIVELRRSASILAEGAVARADEAQELAALAAWVRTEIMQCAQTVATVKTAVDAVSKTSAEMNATAATVQDILRETSFASLNLGIGAVQAGEQQLDLPAVLQQVRALADRAARAASSLSGAVAPNSGKASAAVAVMDKALADIDAVGHQVEIIEDRVAMLARASAEDVAVTGEAECLARELEAGARVHANIVEKTVLAMNALSRSLGRLEMKLGPFPQPGAPTPANTSRPSGPRPYLRRVK